MQPCVPGRQCVNSAWQTVADSFFFFHFRVGAQQSPILTFHHPNNGSAGGLHQLVCWTEFSDRPTVSTGGKLVTPERHDLNHPNRVDDFLHFIFARRETIKVCRKLLEVRPGEWCSAWSSWWFLGKMAQKRFISYFCLNQLHFSVTTCFDFYSLRNTSRI